MSHRARGYFAAPLFNAAERRFNLEVVNRLEIFVNIFLPQRDGGLLPELLRQGMPQKQAETIIFSSDMAALKTSSFLIAVLDGSTVDAGVAFEVGYMQYLGRPCWGLQTDMRRALPTGNNPMLTGSIAKIYHEVSALEDSLRRRYE